MPRPVRFAAALVLTVSAPLAAQRRPPASAAAPAPIRVAALRADLYTIAHDSMGGRQTGESGNARTADHVAEQFRLAGLDPAGENGGWFQAIPFARVAPVRTERLVAGDVVLLPGRDFAPVGQPTVWSAAGLTAVFGGVVGDTASYAAAAQTAGRLVVFAVQPGAELRTAFGAANGLRRDPRFAGIAGLALAAMDLAGSDLVDQLLQGQITADTASVPARPPTLLVSRAAAAALIGGSLDAARAGQAGPGLTGGVRYAREPLAFPARNVIGVLRGADPALRNTYVALSAHNDHVGFTGGPVDHDSVRAFNTVVRPLGADSRNREPTAAEATRIAHLRDSLRALRAPRADSVFNGADDDGSGTVGLMEIARSLGRGARPRRSILFVSHAAEERGLLGSRWFTDHPTVPRDSIIAEIDEDMIGRGGAADLPGGGPAYLEVIGARRLSREFGDTLEAVNRRQAMPFAFNYEFDAPGHPLQYYCRADHYSYARYSIPAVALSRGEHMDYHQVTDEPQYIDYEALARVATLVRDAALAIANMDHRPALDGPRLDPRAPCRQ